MFGNPFSTGTLAGAKAGTPTLPSTSSSSGMTGMTGMQGLSIITQGLSSIGDFMSYRGLASAKDLQAGLYDIEAGSVTQSGIESAEILRSQGNRFVSRQRAIYAKSGVKFEGSPADVYRITEKNIAKDVLKTRLNAVQKANQLRMAGLQERIAAGQARTRSIQALGQGVLSMAGAYAMK